jgi:hypothetical protein
LMGVRTLQDIAYAIKRPNYLDACSESFGNPLHVQTWIVEVQADEACCLDRRPHDVGYS